MIVQLRYLPNENARAVALAFAIRKPSSLRLLFAFDLLRLGLWLNLLWLDLWLFGLWHHLWLDSHRADDDWCASGGTWCGFGCTWCSDRCGFTGCAFWDCNRCGTVAAFAAVHAGLKLREQAATVAASGSRALAAGNVTAAAGDGCRTVTAGFFATERSGVTRSGDCHHHDHTVHSDRTSNVVTGPGGRAHALSIQGTQLRHHIGASWYNRIVVADYISVNVKLGVLGETSIVLERKRFGRAGKITNRNRTG